MPDCFVCLAADSLRAGNGGICRVARLAAKVLAERASGGGLRAAAHVLSDESLPADLGLPVDTARGSRARFVLRNWRTAFRRTHFVYDFVGMARAHCLLPGLRRPFLSFIHGIEVWENASPHRIPWARRADLLVANSHYTRQRAQAVHGGFERARVCWLGTETDEPAAGFGEPPDLPTVLVLGRLEPRKGHDALIECWPRVTAAVPRAVLRIVGGGPRLQELRRKAAQSSAAERIRIDGFIPEAEMPSVWSQTSLMAMPSRGEGFGLVYVEAMRHGVPVIASVHDAGQEVNLDGVTGCNVDLDRPDELPDRVVELLKDTDKARSMGRAGQQRWQEHFTFSAFRSRFAPILDEFLSL